MPGVQSPKTNQKTTIFPRMKETFDQKARSWDDKPRRLELAESVFSALSRAIPLEPGWTVMDFGCGTGLLALPLARQVHRVTGADGSRGMLEVLMEKAQASGIQNLEGVFCDFPAEPLPDGPFDLIASAMTLHHVEDTAGLLQAFHERLHPGGRLAIADLDTEDGTFHSPGTKIAHSGFDRQALAERVRAAGFSEIQFVTAARIERNNRVYPVFLLTARKP